MEKNKNDLESIVYTIDAPTYIDLSNSESHSIKHEYSINEMTSTPVEPKTFGMFEKVLKEIERDDKSRAFEWILLVYNLNRHAEWVDLEFNPMPQEDIIELVNSMRLLLTAATNNGEWTESEFRIASKITSSIQTQTEQDGTLTLKCDFSQGVISSMFRSLKEVKAK